ncbi:BamA/TamA family outer membrane protein [Confluentibacter flavum]|uniref:Bacterial surface antigen (D15) domain-containing protein n=1 Tax=Confluentibacter flavum TaxID=1909700 RepID=A0A2N3HHC1_9FLAO|nr:hypothetical protein [Confluentibacter flavum]PKQ44370.1 hypothetical protein CSW08_13230 [Confluentibacter flavum]
MNLKKIFLTVALCLLSNAIMAQRQTSGNDSTEVYKKIEDYSKRRKFTKAIHGLIFRSANENTQNKRKKITTQSYKPFHGKPIRNIVIETMDPFGYSVDNPNKTSQSWLGTTGNHLHLKSKDYAIRNLLLFNQGALLDTFKISESKRLLRSQKFIRSVKIDIDKVGNKTDSVDVTVRVLDSWSLIPKGSISQSKMNIGLEERNFFGIGHEFNNRFDKKFEDKSTAHSIEYVISNIKNTYINTRLIYIESLEGDLRKSLSIDRGFISPLTRWAGGIYLDKQVKLDSLADSRNYFQTKTFKFQTQDFWIGHAFKIFSNNSLEERTTNLITSVRFANVAYKESPEMAFDSINYFSKEKFYLGAIGLASRQFVEDHFIFRDGIIEDVPIGFAISFTPGYQIKNDVNRYYVGGNIAFADYLKWGYFNANIGYGTFINGNKKEQTALSVELNYFTNLISLGSKWKMRQFIKPQILLGYNRKNTIADRLNLNENYYAYGYDRNEFKNHTRSGIPGFNANIYGTQKAILSFQAQFYSPWDILGFRLNPYVNITGGILGDADESLFDSKLYSSFGVGFIIRNDYLVFSSFQLSLSYYPVTPNSSGSVFKTNAFESNDFGFQQIDVGKPSTLWYR